MIVFGEIGSAAILETGLVRLAHDKTTDCLVHRPTKDKTSSCNNNLHRPSVVFPKTVRLSFLSPATDAPKKKVLPAG